MSTVLVSALVAAVVTLGIEFFAKPSLEVRKERILEKHRRRRTVMTHWRALERGLSLLTERVRAETPRRHDADDLHTSIAQHAADLRAAITVSDDELGNLEVSDMLEVADAWEQYQSVRADWPGNHQLDQVVKIEIQPLSERTFELIAVPRWRKRKRRRVRTSPLAWEP